MTTIAAILDARGAQRPGFSPDGRVLYYCSDRDGRMQLWSMPLAGGEHTRLSDVDRVGRYEASPDGRWIAFGADRGGNERWAINLLPAGGGEPRDLTAVAERIHHLVGWRPDSGAVFVATNRRDPRFFDLVEVPIDGGPPRTLFAHDGTGGSGTVLADGRVIFRTDRERADRNHLTLISPDGTARRLTPEEPPAFHGAPHEIGGALLARSDRDRDFIGIAELGVAGEHRRRVTPEHDIEELATNGDAWAYDVNVDGWSELHAVRGGDDRAVAGLPHGALASDAFGESLAMSRDGTIAVAWAAFERPSTIWVIPPGEAPRLAVDATMDGVDAADLPSAELVSWPTFDGRRIPGWLLRPRGAKHPGAAIAQVHGGPEGQARPLWNPLTIALVSAGFTVLQPNVRGSSGYGRAYLSLDDVRLRMDSVKDLDAGAAWLVEQGIASPDRIGVIGGSYGGFMTLAAIAFFPKRWAAAVAIVAIGRWRTFLERTDPWRRPLREVEYGTIERDGDFLESISPFNHLEAIRAPLMVIHGANDPRVPINEAEQMVGALRERTHDVAYLRYEDEGHGLAKAKNRADAWPKVVQFFTAKLEA
ncbi:MAG TPA: S9 family peptidase [Candidatus Limnocylindria bacterium]